VNQAGISKNYPREGRNNSSIEESDAQECCWEPL
jgi:hypothetical protein